MVACAPHQSSQLTLSQWRLPSLSPSATSWLSGETSSEKQLPQSLWKDWTSPPVILSKHLALIASSLQPARIRFYLGTKRTQLTIGLRMSPFSCWPQLNCMTGSSKLRMSHNFTPSPRVPPPVTTYFWSCERSTESPEIDVLPPILAESEFALTSQNLTCLSQPPLTIWLGACGLNLHVKILFVWAGKTLSPICWTYVMRSSSYISMNGNLPATQKRLLSDE